MKTKIPLALAEGIATKFMDELRQDCERIEIVGSIRRRKPEVGDFELLFIPKVENRRINGDMFNRANMSLADITLGNWLSHGIVSKRPGAKGQFSWGDKNKFAIHNASGFACDFFATTAENWWNSLVIRTGGKDTNLLLTTGAHKLGRTLNAYGCGVTESDGTVIPATSEEDVFRLCGVEYQKPEDRV